MISGSKGVAFTVTRTSARVIVIELHESLKESPNEFCREDLLGRCILEAQKTVDKAMREYAISN